MNINNPRLSTLLTGTPRHILNLITDAENGLFSRFIFYFLDLRLVWNDVFSTHADTTLDEHFQALGREFHGFHTILEKSQDIRFALTPVQAADFNERFSAWQSEYSASCGDEFIASVRRLGLITFRLAMILSALRIMEDGIIENNLTCLDTDYQSAMTMASVILRHNAHIFLSLPKADTAQTTSSTTTARTTFQQRQFLEALRPISTARHTPNSPPPSASTPAPPTASSAAGATPANWRMSRTGSIGRNRITQSPKSFITLQRQRRRRL